METNEKLIDKIKKLLAKSSNNPSEAEASACFLKAQEMLAKAGLSMEAVIGSEEQVKEIVKEYAHEFTKMPWWYPQLGNIIAQNFRCYLYISTWGGKSATTFMGLKQDVEISKALFQYALLFIKYQCQLVRRKVRKQGLPTDGVANDYISGFLSGLHTRFQEQVENNNWGLVLVKDNDLVAAFEEMNLQKRSKEHRVTRAHNAAAYAKGFEHGKSFDKPAGQIEA